jgi:hypothetical protein
MIGHRPRYPFAIGQTATTTSGGTAIEAGTIVNPNGRSENDASLNAWIPTGS